MSWAKRHLNWNLVLSLFAINAAVLSLAFTLPPGDWITAVLIFLDLGLMLCVEIWYLRQKARSLWFLLFNLLPAFLFWIAFLLLSNKREMEDG